MKRYKAYTVMFDGLLADRSRPLLLTFSELAASFLLDLRVISVQSAPPLVADCSSFFLLDSDCCSVLTGLFSLSSGTSESDETNKSTCPSSSSDAYLTDFLLPVSADLNAGRDTVDCLSPSSSHCERELPRERPDPDLSMSESASVLS